MQKIGPTLHKNYMGGKQHVPSLLENLLLQNQDSGDNISNRYIKLIHIRGDFQIYETKGKEGTSYIRVFAVSGYDMVFLAVSDTDGGSRTYRKRQLHSIRIDVHPFDVSGKSLVRIFLPGRRNSGMHRHVQ